MNNFSYQGRFVTFICRAFDYNAYRIEARPQFLPEGRELRGMTARSPPRFNHRPPLPHPPPGKARPGGQGDHIARSRRPETRMTPHTFLATIPPIRVEYWADGKRIATRQIPSTQTGFTENSEFFSCNVCQETWGWIYYPNRHWHFIYQDCAAHNSRRYADLNIPGSLLSPGAWELDTFPLPVLKREFEVHLAELERRKKDGNTTD